MSSPHHVAPEAPVSGEVVGRAQQQQPNTYVCTVNGGNINIGGTPVIHQSFGGIGLEDLRKKVDNQGETLRRLERGQQEVIEALGDLQKTLGKEG